MENTILILKEAQKAADDAATKCFARLVEQGAQYLVVNDSLFSDPGIPKKVVGTMLDLCGNAYLTISGLEPFTRFLKKIGKTENNDPNRYSGDFWSISKSSYKGYILHITHKLSMRQEMRIHESAMIAAANVLKSHRINVGIKTFMD